jgi:hypothetical protein
MPIRASGVNPLARSRPSPPSSTWRSLSG